MVCQRVQTEKKHNGDSKNSEELNNTECERKINSNWADCNHNNRFQRIQKQSNVFQPLNLKSMVMLFQYFKESKLSPLLVVSISSKQFVFFRTESYYFYYKQFYTKY